FESGLSAFFVGCDVSVVASRPLYGGFSASSTPHFGAVTSNFPSACASCEAPASGEVKYVLLCRLCEGGVEGFFQLSFTGPLERPLLLCLYLYVYAAMRMQMG
ncbi:hypothetical protein ABE493_19250, partial [Stenotrophomonas terrae]|uniref:hypothetical protein n=1 Tax=Stenotrophomonas terrae TaxID=405446 RepID=UPI003208209C